MDEVAPEPDESQLTNSIVDQIDDEIDPLLVDDKNMDKDYEQGDEVDDETTMEEEEALPELEDPMREIRFLEEESNMPIHELMRMYGFTNNAAAPPDNDERKKKKKKKKSSSKKNKDERKKKKLSSPSDEIPDSTEGKNSAKQNTSNESSVSGTQSVSADQGGKSKNRKRERKVYAELPQDYGVNTQGCTQTSKLLNLYVSGMDQVHSENEDEGEDEDEDYKPHWELQWKSVNVGVEFQALVTDGFSTYGDVLPYENNDELLWDPNVLGEDLIEDYLMKIQQITKALKPKTKVVGVRDNEKSVDMVFLVNMLRFLCVAPTLNTPVTEMDQRKKEVKKD